MDLLLRVVAKISGMDYAEAPGMERYEDLSVAVAWQPLCKQILSKLWSLDE